MNNSKLPPTLMCVRSVLAGSASDMSAIKWKNGGVAGYRGGRGNSCPPVKEW